MPVRAVAASWRRGRPANGDRWPSARASLAPVNAHPGREVRAVTIRDVPPELGPPVRRRVRASDEDRERTARSLRAHFAAGRLTADEFERRVAKAYGAHTRRELARLLSDLPADRFRLAVQRFYYGQRVALRYHAATYVAVNGTLVGVWELTGHGLFWPGFVLAPMTAVLGLHASISRWLRRRLRITRGRRSAE
jgi:hypothetical protein